MIKLIKNKRISSEFISTLEVNEIDFWTNERGHLVIDSFLDEHDIYSIAIDYGYVFEDDDDVCTLTGEYLDTCECWSCSENRYESYGDSLFHNNKHEQGLI